MNKTKQMAKYEIGWWRAHHRRNKEKLIDEMVKLYVLLFGISNEDAKIIVQYRIKATGFHDKAEEYEDQRKPEEADIYWKKAEESLQQHFALLEKLRKR